MIKRFSAFLKPYWWAAVLAPLLMLGEVFTDVLQPTLMSRIIDQGVANGDMQMIIATGVQMVIVAILGIVGGFGCSYFSTLASYGFGADLRDALYRKIQQFTFQNLDRFRTGSLVTRLTNDVTQMQNVVQSILRIFVRAPFLVIGGIFMAVRLNSQLASVLVVSVPILAIALTIIIRRGFPMFKRVQKALDGVNTVMQENLSGVRVVKGFVRGEYEIGRFGERNNALRDETIKANKNNALTGPVLNLTMNFSIIGVLWLSSGIVKTGNLPIGQVMALISYMTQILFALMMSSFVLTNVSRAKVSGDRILEVLDVAPEIRSDESALQRTVERGEVRFDNVSFQYEGAGGEPVLKNISFYVKPGETLAILGATGVGKTTLVNLIPRLYDPTSGRILIDDVDVRDYRLPDLRAGIGVVLQESVLFTGSVDENLRWGGRDRTEQEVLDAMTTAQAAEFVNAMPEKKESLIGRKGVNLSGGQKQRLSIARALLKHPKILIMDDSTSAVDMNTEARIQTALRDEKCTVILIAQRISSVMDADRIIVLENGELVSSGTHHQLLESSPVYREICASQLGLEAV